MPFYFARRMEIQYKFKREPMVHQIKEFRHHLSKKYSATWSETGAGKTFPILAATEFRFRHGLISSCLYVAPNSILDKIADEVWINTNLTCTVLQASTRKKRIDLIKADTDIHIINYEALDPYLEFLQGRYDCMIADEAHRVKGYNSKTNKALIKISKNCKYRIAATGTPMCSAPEDMYGIYRFLDQSVFGTSVTRFREKWCNRVPIQIYTGGGSRTVEKTEGLKPGTEEAFRKACMAVAVLHQKKDCLDLPDRVSEIRKVSLSSTLKKRYDEIRKKSLLELPDGRIMELSTGGARYAKCAQICSGFLKYGDDHFDLALSPKIAELDDILSQREDKKTVVWARHKHVIKMLLNRYKKFNPVCQIGGQDNTIQRKKFQEEDSCKLIINQTNISDGYELTASDCAVYFELPWSWQHFKQSQDRTHRKGSEQHDKITYFYLVTKNTIEESVLKVLQDRKNLADVIPGNEESLLTGDYCTTKE